MAVWRRPRRPGRPERRHVIGRRPPLPWFARGTRGGPTVLGPWQAPGGGRASVNATSEKRNGPDSAGRPMAVPSRPPTPTGSVPAPSRPWWPRPRSTAPARGVGDRRCRSPRTGPAGRRRPRAEQAHPDQQQREAAQPGAQDDHHRAGQGDQVARAQRGRPPSSFGCLRQRDGERRAAQHRGGLGEAGHGRRSGHLLGQQATDRDATGHAGAAEDLGGDEVGQPTRTDHRATVEGW